jgi:hypothetical protein
MRRNSEINAEIFNHGVIFFDSLCNEIRLEATRSASPIVHEVNKQLLESAISSVLAQAVYKADRSQDELWQVIWQRVVYAGTLSSKATAEISSMIALVPLFQSLDNYVEESFIFDQQEWDRFQSHWKGRYPNNWLMHSKLDPEWNPSSHFEKTTQDVWKIMIKDDATYPGLKFSSLPHKMEKYISVARSLNRRRVTSSRLAQNYYTEGYNFNPKHLIGQAWIDERLILDRVRERFTKEIGKLTALHTMMDLGLKTIKPDRVMTYLFSQLGWLQTLPDTLSKDHVMQAYDKQYVVDEMTIRSDVLANRLDRAGYQKAHRLLDIWLVKYGQEPEPSWGITVNLQRQVRNIRLILDKAKARQTTEPESVIDEHTAAQMWPGTDFTSVPTIKKPQNMVGSGECNEGSPSLRKTEHQTPKTPKQAKQAKARRIGAPSRRLPKEFSEKTNQLFVAEWKKGRANHPDIYPPRIENDPKDAILRLIESGVEPEIAFLSVLRSGIAT